MAFYLLDGAASNTPPLLGSKEMKERKAAISYTAEHLIHYDLVNDQWRASHLTMLPGGHLLLDLQTESRSFDRWMNERNLRRFNAFERRDDDEDDGGDGPDGGDRPGGDGPTGRRAGGNKRNRGDPGGHQEVDEFLSATIRRHRGGGVEPTMSLPAASPGLSTRTSASKALETANEMATDPVAEDEMRGYSPNRPFSHSGVFSAIGLCRVLTGVGWDSGDS